MLTPRVVPKLIFYPAYLVALMQLLLARYLRIIQSSSYVIWPVYFCVQYPCICAIYFTYFFGSHFCENTLNFKGKSINEFP